MCLYMDAASRPKMEPFSDLPVEEPLDAATARREPPGALPAPPVVQGAGAPAATSKDPEQSGLNFVDPEMFLAAGQQLTAVPVTGPSRESAPTPELELEDPVVDDMLTAPPPAPAAASKPAAVAMTPPPPASAKPESISRAAEPRSARVPIAKTASLSVAATKLAAAVSQRTVSASASASRAAAPPVPTVRSAPASQQPPRAADASPPKAGAQSTAKLDAPSLASWASARSAATPAAKVNSPLATPAAVTPTAAVAPVPAPSVRPKAATSAPAPVAAPTPMPVTSAPMDRDFIARNQVVERYLTGRLPLRGATDFERFCHEHPELLDEIGLPERVNAGLRLLEASGKPEPWQEAPRPAWQKPQMMLGLAAAVVVLGVALGLVASGSAGKSHRVADLQKRLTEQALDPATSTREIRLLPSRSGASNTPAITVGGGKAELANLKIDETRSPYHNFRITIDRIDQGRVGVLWNMAKDSNGHLRIALNSSALGPGSYQLTLEGIDWRGEPQPDSWVTIGIAR